MKTKKGENTNLEQKIFLFTLAAGHSFFLDEKRIKKIKAAGFRRPTYGSIPKGREAGPCGAF
ncbi:MAG: hypothetical protein MH137_04420 [Flavobacteriales bacterium]|nr:hypothetical protein [Flavobacteriales bacterium]